ncbi:MAG TPA: lysozyme inhibitor LprI family protein [Gemmatimonadaceae bacterium]|nr:lysozyme inhibitor LprI family protein [Gemmatimonadaceae bacterium]
MKILTRRAPFLLSAVLVQALVISCKGSEKEESPPIVQDSMLLRDLAAANRNTAAADLDTTIPITVRSRPESETDGLVTVAGGGTNAGQVLTPSGSTPRPTSTSEPRASSGTGSRIAPPRRARDAPSPTNVPTGNVRPGAIGDPCDSPAADDQRTCLNRSIARSDVELNRVYQELISQARRSGGAELEERFRVRQRAWILTRDRECRQQTRSQEGELWARLRGRCLGEYSARRTAELQESLNSLRGL